MYPTKNTVFAIFLSIFLGNCASYKTITSDDRQKILSQLNEIKILDQKYAGTPPNNLINKYGPEASWKVFEAQRDSVSSLNLEKIKRLYDKYGYLGERRIGKQGAIDFWLPIQHADNQVSFQEEILRAMSAEIKKGSKDNPHYAMLEDRIHVNKNMRQRFGSQVTYNFRGQAVPKVGLIDSTKIDSLRTAYGLPKFKDYYNQMTKIFFDMNKQHLLDKGITKPVLYE